MIVFAWNEEKNKWLQKTRNVSFEEVEDLIEKGEIITIINNPNQIQYPNQKMYILSIKGYTCTVPFIRTGNTIFLKTIYASRKAHKRYQLK